jgi:hypothetical protein
MTNTIRTVTITLTDTQLTDIRVACLHRLDTLSNVLKTCAPDQRPVLEAARNRVHAMMDEGGVLLAAMRRIHGASMRPPEVI